MAIYDLDEGTYDVSGARFGIVAARFNHRFVNPLLTGATAAFERHGIAAGALDIVRVPGAFELPLAASWLAESGDVAAVIALGCVIRGDTPHFEYVCGEAARGIASIGLRSGKPCIFGVLTVDNDRQAEERTGGRHGNKGEEAALAALEMTALARALGRRT